MLDLSGQIVLCFVPMVVSDDNVKRVMEIRDLDPDEKVILIDLLMRMPEPVKEEDGGPLGVTIMRQGKAPVREDDIAERTRIHPRKLRRKIKRLVDRGYIDKIKGKGQSPNRYAVKFPKRQKKQPNKDTPLPIEAIAPEQPKATPKSPATEPLPADPKPMQEPPKPQETKKIIGIDPKTGASIWSK